MGILNEIKNGTFTDSEQYILNYVLDHLDQVPNMTIRALAQNTSSSNSSILRLCRKLGTDGYRSFVLELARDAARNQEAIDWAMPFSSLDSPEKVIRSMSSLSQQVTETVAAHLDANMVSRAALAIIRAQRIFIAGAGDSAARLETFRHMLLKLGKFLIPVELTGDTGAYAANATSRDCLLAVSYGGSHRPLIHTVKEFHRHDVYTVVITANTEGNLAQQADTVVGFPRKASNPASIGPFYAQMSIDFILQTLYGMIYSLHWQENEQKKAASDASNRLILNE